MGDAELRRLRAEAKRDPSPTTLLRLAHSLARAGAWDEAAQQGTIAAATLDASDLWDALTPPLDALEARTVRLDVCPQDVRWTPEGRGVIGIAQRALPELVEVDLASGAARTIVVERDDLQLYWDGSAPTMDPRGRYVAFGSGLALDEDGVTPEAFVVTARRDTGEVMAKVTGAYTEQLVITGEGHLAWREATGRTRVFQLDAAGALARSKPIVTLRKRDRQRFSTTGDLVRQVGDGIQLADVRGKAHRGTAQGVNISKAGAIGRRLFDWWRKGRLRLHGADGALLAEVTTPTDWANLGPTRSGRLVALGYADGGVAGAITRVEVVELDTGARREFSCEGVSQLLWSPSGRRLIGLPLHDEGVGSGAPCDALVVEAR